MIFTIDRDLATCVLYDGLTTKLQSAVDRNLFINQFSAPINNEVISISAEFDTNLFHIQDKDGLHVYESPSQNPIIQFFADNKEQLYFWFLDQENMLQKPSEFHVYDELSHSWSLSSENKLLLESDNARKQRNKLLSLSDWTQCSDVSAVIKLKWVSYRQALRDITEQSGFPENIDWPQTPN